MTLAEVINEQIEHLTDGGGVTSPDDMVNIDDVKKIVDDVCAHVKTPNCSLVNNKINDYLSFTQMVNGNTLTLDIIQFQNFLRWIQAQLK